MAQEWRGLSNHQKAFKANRERASEAAALVTKEFVESVTGSAIAEREAAEEAAAAAGEVDIMEGARKLLRSRRVKEADHAQEREERAEARRTKPAPVSPREEPAPSPVASGTVSSRFETLTEGLSFDDLHDLGLELSAAMDKATQKEDLERTREWKEKVAADQAKAKADGGEEEYDEYGNPKSEYYPEHLPEAGDGA